MKSRRMLIGDEPDIVLLARAALEPVSDGMLTVSESQEDPEHVSVQLSRQPRHGIWTVVGWRGPVDAWRAALVEAFMDYARFRGPQSLTALPPIGFPYLVSALPVLSRVRSIEEFDGPILTELVDVHGNAHLEKWCDQRGSVARSLRVQSSHRDLAEYIDGRISLRELLLNAGVGFLVDVDQTGEIVAAFSIFDIRHLPSEYLPSEDAMHDKSLT